MLSIKYCGTYQDISGYGEANRADIVSLFNTGVNITTELVVQTIEKTNYGFAEAICAYCKSRDIPYKIKIIHLTPDLYPKYQEHGKYHIGRLMWETDKLPDEWVTPCNGMNEIWTASEKQAGIIKNSGVKVPVYWFPQAVNTFRSEENIHPFEIKYKKDFMFYSIFQWIERKNPRTLIRAFCKAFQGVANVSLLLKTYRVNYQEGEFGRIRADITNWIKELRVIGPPPIYLAKTLLKESEIPKLHALGDVYVNTSSGEGYCRPIAEAMVYGKPVISADNGGVTDYLTEEHYFKVPSHATQVKAVHWIPWYSAEQNWWEIDENELANKMKHVYLNQSAIPPVAHKGKEWVVNNCSYNTVGEKLKKRLEEIYKII